MIEREQDPNWASLSRTSSSESYDQFAMMIAYHRLSCLAVGRLAAAGAGPVPRASGSG